MKIYSKNKVYSNMYYDIFVNGVEFANGLNGTYISLHNKLGGVVVVARHDDKYVLLEIERLFVGGKRLEFVRGFKKPGETSEQAAVREVKEEINCDVKSAKAIGCVEPDSGIIENAIDIVEVELDNTAQVLPSDYEGIKRVVLLSEDEIIQRIKANEIKDGYTLSAFAIHYVKTHEKSIVTAGS